MSEQQIFMVGGEEPTPEPIKWLEQCEWFSMRSMQLDPQIQPVEHQELLVIASMLQNGAKDGPIPETVLKQSIERLYTAMGVQKVSWLNKLRPELLPLLCVGPQTGIFILHSRNPDGTWMAENTSELIQLEKLPEDIFYADLLGQSVFKNRGMALRLFKNVLQEHKSFFVWAAVLTIFMNLLALMTSFYSMQVYDRVIPSQGINTLYALTGGVFISIIIETIFKFGRSYIMDQAIESMDIKLSHQIFERLLRVRMDQFPASVGTLSAQLRSYEMIRSFATSATLYLLVDTPFALLFLAVIWLIAGASIASIPLMFFLVSLGVGLLFKRRADIHTKSSQAASNRKLGLLVEAVNGAESIKANGASWHFLGKWNALTRLGLTEDLKVRHISESGMYYAAALQQVSYTGLVAAGAYLAATTTDLTSGGLIACSILSGRVLQPVTMLPGLIVQWANAKASLSSIEAVFKLQSDNHDTEQPINMPNIKGDLQVDDIAFAYPSRPQTLYINALKINSGERVAIIGGIGSGKSTLLKLLSGLYKPQKGRILLDGMDIQHIARTHLSRRIGYIPQHVHLFSGTLRENLLNGLLGVSDQYLQQVCQATGVIQIVNSHSKGFDMQISEGGGGVSGGQRQLIGLTRMLLARPSLWLLDEPTSNMDEGTEQRILQILTQLIKPEETLIFVAHKPQLLMMATRIIVIGSGGVVVDGPRDAVIKHLHEQAMKQQQAQQGNAGNQSGENTQTQAG